MMQRNGPVGSRQPARPKVELANIQILRTGTKLASCTIIVDDLGLEIRQCLLHQDAINGNRWVQFPTRAYIKSDSLRGFETTHRFKSRTAERAFHDAVFEQFDVYLANAQTPRDAIDEIFD